MARLFPSPSARPTINGMAASRSRRGSALVEFALVFAVLFSILAAIFEFGRALWYYNALARATRDGARMMSVAAKATIASSAVAAAKAYVVSAVASGGVNDPAFTTANVTVTCLDSTYASSTCVDGTAPGGVTVAVTGYTVSIGRYVPLMVGSSATYTASFTPSTTMRYQPN